MVENIGAHAPKIVHCQTVMLKSDLDALKVVTGCSQTKDALEAAALNEINRAHKRKVVA